MARKKSTITIPTPNVFVRGGAGLSGGDYLDDSQTFSSAEEAGQAAVDSDGSYASGTVVYALVPMFRVVTPSNEFTLESIN